MEGNGLAAAAGGGAAAVAVLAVGFMVLSFFKYILKCESEIVNLCSNKAVTTLDEVVYIYMRQSRLRYTDSTKGTFCGDRSLWSAHVPHIE